jgi:BirA family biotin operon repressor/biotin-[acetyl-CoA-carboxylase] ligase
MKGIIIKKLETADSTQTVAKQMALAGAKDWTVVVSDQQSGGYGKAKSSWASPKGGLYFSVILPKANISDLQLITILAAFSVAKILKEKFPLEPMIKLPNDVYVNGKKICGVLTENVIGGDLLCSIIGIGLNTNIKELPKEVENIATSIFKETGQEANNEEILENIVKELQNNLKIISQ